MRVPLPAVLCLGLLLCGSAPLARAGAEPDLGRVRRLTDDLRSRYLEEREAAKGFLIEMVVTAQKLAAPSGGPPDKRAREAALASLGGIERSMVQALLDPDVRIREVAAQVLGRIATATAVEALIDALEREDGEMRDRAVQALEEIGPKAKGAVERRLAQHPEGSPPLKLAMQAFLRAQVEKELEKLITERDSCGFFNGQFAEIVILGKSAVPILLGMFTQPSYAFRESDPKRRHIMRSLAGEALADMNDPSIVPSLVTLFQSETSAAELAFGAQDLEDTLAYVLFRLGEKQYLTDMAHRLKSYLDASNGQADLRPRLTGLLVRMGDYAGAESLYNQMLGDPQRGDWAHYNLACLFAIQKKKAKALQHLRDAIQAGFNDVDWIKQDGDLKNLHGDPDYEQLIRSTEERDRFGKRPPK